jgi:hypothetical protein
MKEHLARAGAAALSLAVLAIPAAGAPQNDPDWPCEQRKVAELSLGQFWNGPALPASAQDWEQDDAVSTLVDTVSQRRIPVADAQKQIRDFAAALPAGQKQPKLAMLVQGLFDHMNQERSHVIGGIGRYAHKQADLAAYVRKEESEVDALRAKPDADPDEVEKRSDQLDWDTRVFQERVQSLRYVCEVPTIIEQRLYALVKTVAETLKEK